MQCFPFGAQHFGVSGSYLTRFRQVKIDLMMRMRETIAGIEAEIE